MISFSFISFSLTSFSHFPGLEFWERFPAGISGVVSTWNFRRGFHPEFWERFPAGISGEVSSQNFRRAFHPEFWERFPAGILGEISTQNYGSVFYLEFWERFPPGILGEVSTWNFGRAFQLEFWESFPAGILGEVSTQNFGRGFHLEFWERFPPRISGELSTQNYGSVFYLEFWERFPLGIMGEVSTWNFGRGFQLEFWERLEGREVLQDRGAEVDPWNALGALWSRVCRSNPCGWSCPFPGTGGDTPGAGLTPWDDPYGRSLRPPDPQIPGFRWKRAWLWERKITVVSWPPNPGIQVETSLALGEEDHCGLLAPKSRDSGGNEPGFGRHGSFQPPLEL
ncbi:uncharacterized protein LOC113994310 [Pipra filicauda]|uniref:Uncharacterized protein LOC113994310 n=1 Tax=Pipra filicauda TaxID=649802 RepID=A0A7R5KGT9_9PASS|nr:uncharacterized protein LOC113994310 [Pipra filicauda]